MTEVEKRKPRAQVTSRFAAAAHGRGIPLCTLNLSPGNPQVGPGRKTAAGVQGAGTAPLVTAEIPTGASRSFEPRLEQMPSPESDLL